KPWDENEVPRSSAAGSCPLVGLPVGDALADASRSAAPGAAAAGRAVRLGRRQAVAAEAQGKGQAFALARNAGGRLCRGPAPPAGGPRLCRVRNLSVVPEAGAGICHGDGTRRAGTLDARRA